MLGMSAFTSPNSPGSTSAKLQSVFNLTVQLVLGPDMHAMLHSLSWDSIKACAAVGLLVDAVKESALWSNYAYLMYMTNMVATSAPTALGSFLGKVLMELYVLLRVVMFIWLIDYYYYLYLHAKQLPLIDKFQNTYLLLWWLPWHTCYECCYSFAYICTLIFASMHYWTLLYLLYNYH